MNVIGNKARSRRDDADVRLPSAPPPRLGRDGQARRRIRSIQGFKAHVLTSGHVQITVVPELGARIISLKDLRTGREWLWHPDGRRKLFRNDAGESFDKSPLAGIDECFPTIAPCSWQGRDLPDHGEAWAAVWTVDNDAWKRGLLRTSLSLKISPFDFERTVELRENEVRFTYELRNRGTSEECYLWAMHPLLRLQMGDELELPLSTRMRLEGASWINDLTSSCLNGTCEKVFASMLSEGWAAINNSVTGDRLQFEWDPSRNNTLGLWFNGGGWHSHQHFALEPANGEPDLLTVAAQRNRCGKVAGHGLVVWHVWIRVGNPDCRSRLEES
jgi:hypothetical protein